MKTVEVPKWVRKEMSEGEEALAKTSAGGADYYATNKRILRFKGKSNSEDLDYDRVSIEKKNLGMRYYGLGGLLVVLGLGLIYVAIQGGGQLLIFAIVGVLAIVMPFSMLPSRYEIVVKDANGKLIDRWKLNNTRWGAKDRDTFVRLVNEKHGGTLG
jgi:hypothetical protein